jgi:hypothetical protein
MPEQDCPSSYTNVTLAPETGAPLKVTVPDTLANGGPPTSSLQPDNARIAKLNEPMKANLLKSVCDIGTDSHGKENEKAGGAPESNREGRNENAGCREVPASGCETMITLSTRPGPISKFDRAVGAVA